MQTRRTFLFAATGLAVSLPFAGFAQSAKSGTFTGAQGHVSSGGVQLTGDSVILLDDFKLDGGPDPKVALGRNGYDASTLMGRLSSFSGRQIYSLPAGVDASDYNEVYIWCERFNVPLAVAKVN